MIVLITKTLQKEVSFYIILCSKLKNSPSLRWLKSAHIKILYSKKHWRKKNFGKFCKIQQFAKFLPILTIFITLSMKIDFKVFTAKLPTFLICQTFYHQSFHYTTLLAITQYKLLLTLYGFLILHYT